MTIIRQRIVQELYDKMNQAQITKSVIANNNINADGSWSDIKYDAKDISNWNPIKHLDRIQTLAIAYTDPKSVYAGNKDLFQKISNGLHYWYQKDPRSSNWWHNDIAAPQTMGRILLLMDGAKEKLSSDLLNGLLSRMATTRTPFAATGANKLDIAIHYIYRALVTRNDKLMNIGMLEAFQPIEFTTGEGLQYDYSFQQHKEQLMIASYGLVFIEGEYQIASWLRDTKYALSKEKLELLNHYFFNTFINALRGGYSDYNIEGRGISRVNILDRRAIATDKPGSVFSHIESVNPGRTKEISIIRERILGKQPPSYGIQPLHDYFWKGDYTLHVRPNYSFNVRTVSTRTIRTETGNKENLLGTVLPDGSVDLVRRGDEYFNIMPVWEWDKIPGVTARDYDTAVTMKVQWGEYGSTKFVGGVSDGLYGATVYEQNYDDVQAKKSYFFFDDEVVCMGAGISSKTPQSITTTLNQAWNKGKILISTNNVMSTFKKKANFDKTQWVWHDSIAYIFPDARNVTVSNDMQTGSWRTINNSQKGEVKGNVFKLWISHGQAPVAGSYEYIVVPGISDKQVASYNNSNVQIISNTEDMQAVTQKELKIVQAIFYKPGTLIWNGVRIKVDAPCVLQLRDIDKTIVKLTIADPAQQLQKMNVEISTSKVKDRKVEVEFPQELYKGKSVKVDVQ